VPGPSSRPAQTLFGRVRLINKVRETLEAAQTCRFGYGAATWKQFFVNELGCPIVLLEFQAKKMPAPFGPAVCTRTTPVYMVTKVL